MTPLLALHTEAKLSIREKTHLLKILQWCFNLVKNRLLALKGKVGIGFFSSNQVGPYIETDLTNVNKTKTTSRPVGRKSIGPLVQGPERVIAATWLTAAPRRGVEWCSSSI